GIGGAHQRQTLLDRAYARLLQVLVWPGAVAEPAVIGEIDEPARPLARRHRLAGQHDLVADKRQEGGRAGHGDWLARGARNMTAAHFRELHQPEAFEKIL